MRSREHDLRTPPRQRGEGSAGGRVHLAGLSFDRLTEAQVVEHVMAAIQAGQGGWIVTPNIDICRSVRVTPAHRDLVESASLVVPDGMPLLWAARMLSDPLPERVAGASLIFSLSEAAARAGAAVYLLGGEPGVPEKAGEELCRRYPGLRVAGAYAPPFGFDSAPGGMETARDRVTAATVPPKIVFVGLGFPRQERVITSLAPFFPGTWFVGCGAAIPFAAGAFKRAPEWMQRAGLEWSYRLLSEPRRLFRRYLINDLPYAVRLLSSCAARRLTGRRRG